jgi:RHS repeat-associated protein
MKLSQKPTAQNDYYPFGMQMPGRNGTISGGEYRYAFNGMETDAAVSGTGNSYTTQFRQYDPRLGRWKSLDPLAAKYASMSPYIGMGNNPNFYTDPLGLEPEGGGEDEKVKKGDKTTGDDGKEKTSNADETEVVFKSEPKSINPDSNGMKHLGTYNESTGAWTYQPIPAEVNTNTSSSEPDYAIRWLRDLIVSMQGSTEANVGFEFVTKDGRTNPNALPPMKLTLNGKSIEIDADDFGMILDGLARAGTPALPRYKPPMNAAKYRNKYYVKNQKKYTDMKLGKKTMPTMRKDADAAHNNYLKNYSAAYQKELQGYIKDRLTPSPIGVGIKTGTQIRDASKNKAPTDVTEPVIIVLNGSSYMYKNGYWSHIYYCLSCSPADSTYVRTENVPSEVLKEFNNR